jgi:hypothetical protein
MECAGMSRMILCRESIRGRTLMSLARWLYRGGRPNLVARVLNRFTSAVYARGVASNYLVTLEVPGRQSARTISLPLVMVVVRRCAWKKSHRIAARPC